MAKLSGFEHSTDSGAKFIIKPYAKMSFSDSSAHSILALRLFLPCINVNHVIFLYSLLHLKQSQPSLIIFPDECNFYLLMYIGSHDIN